jgi:hypothetical protein
MAFEHKGFPFFFIDDVEDCIKSGEIKEVGERRFSAAGFGNVYDKVVKYAKKNDYEVAYAIGDDYALIMSGAFTVKFYKLNI